MGRRSFFAKFFGAIAATFGIRVAKDDRMWVTTTDVQSLRSNVIFGHNDRLAGVIECCFIWNHKTNQWDRIR